MNKEGQSGRTVKILPSVEMRWFLTEEPSELKLLIYDDHVEAVQEEKRDDYYLCLPRINFVGTKMREYRAAGAASRPKLNLEFKLLEREFDPVTFSQGGTGIMQAWRKWSVELDVNAVEYMDSTTRVPGRWIKVTKTRALRKYIVNAGKAELVLANTRVPQGCNVELTTLEIEGRPKWWSFGFEAFADDDFTDLASILKQTISGFGRSMLQADISYSYPEWLSRL